MFRLRNQQLLLALLMFSFTLQSIAQGTLDDDISTVPRAIPVDDYGNPIAPPAQVTAAVTPAPAATSTPPMIKVSELSNEQVDIEINARKAIPLPADYDVSILPTTPPLTKEDEEMDEDLMTGYLGLGALAAMGTAFLLDQINTLRNHPASSQTHQIRAEIKRLESIQTKYDMWKEKFGLSIEMVKNKVLIRFDRSKLAKLLKSGDKNRAAQRELLEMHLEQERGLVILAQLKEDLRLEFLKRRKASLDYMEAEYRSARDRYNMALKNEAKLPTPIRDQLTRNNSTLDALRSETEQLQTKLIEAREYPASLISNSDKIADLQHAQATLPRLIREKETAIQEIERQNQELLLRHQSGAKGKKLSDTVASERGQVEELTRKLRNLETKLDNFRDSDRNVTSFVAAQEEKVHLQEEISQLRRDLDTHKKNLEQTRAKLIAIVEKNKPTQTSDVEKAQEDMKRARAAIDITGGFMELPRNQIQEQSKIVRNLESERATLETNLAQLSIPLEIPLASRVQQRAKDIAKLRVQLESKNAQFENEKTFLEEMIAEADKAPNVDGPNPFFDDITLAHNRIEEAESIHRLEVLREEAKNARATETRELALAQERHWKSTAREVAKINDSYPSLMNRLMLATREYIRPAGVARFEFAALNDPKMFIELLSGAQTHGLNSEEIQHMRDFVAGFKDDFENSQAKLSQKKYELLLRGKSEATEAEREELKSLADSLVRISDSAVALQAQANNRTHLQDTSTRRLTFTDAVKNAQVESADARHGKLSTRPNPRKYSSECALALGPSASGAGTATKAPRNAIPTQLRRVANSLGLY